MQATSSGRDTRDSRQERLPNPEQPPIPAALTFRAGLWYSVLLRSTTFALLAVLFAAGVLIAQDNSSGPKKPAAKKSAARRRVASKSAPKPAPKTPVKTAAHRRSSKAKATSKAATTRRSTQREPTPERYKEIQQALAEKGYFRGDPDGTWGPESVEALKRFQREQNLTDDGKLGSLSLIALGLGPKRAEPAERPAQQ